MDGFQVEMLYDRLVFSGHCCGYGYNFLWPHVSPDDVARVYKHRKYLVGPDGFLGGDTWKVAQTDGGGWLVDLKDHRTTIDTHGIDGLTDALSLVSTVSGRDLDDLFSMARETDASVTIQSSWKGWKDRMTYRFDPNTSLGKHILLREFAEIKKPDDDGASKISTCKR